MKKINIVVNIIILTFVFLFFTTQKVSAEQTSLKPLIDLMNIFLQQPSFYTSTPPPTLGTPSSIPQPQNLSSTINPLDSARGKPPSSNYIYYPQCDGGFDNLSLPNGCNLCQSGCGPATTSMILSSYVDKKFTPPTVVDLFKQKGLYAGCDGTKITDNQKIINESGLKTTDLLLYTSNQEAIADLKTYIKNGWTIFALGRFCENGCKHFFWITEIDDSGNVWAYDPFYGRNELPPPFNENKYYPFPQYRMAFGVKKL